MSIPKKIHYVWVGGKEKPKKIKKCTFYKNNKENTSVESNILQSYINTFITLLHKIDFFTILLYNVKSYLLINLTAIWQRRTL